MVTVTQSEENRQLVRDIDMEHLALLARRLISSSVRLALLSDTKNHIWTEDESIALALGSLGNDPNFSMMSIDEPHRFIFADRALLEVPLLGQHPDPFALLYLYDYHESLSEASQRPDGVPLLARHIVDAFENKQALQRLHQDLDSRSDELDLAINIQDKNITSNDWREIALNHLREFDQTLEFGMTAALFTDYNYTPQVSFWHRHESEQTAILNTLREEALPWALFNKTSIIVNQAGDGALSAVAPSLPFKLMLTPLHNAHDVIIGAVVTLNSIQDREFTQSDQNLQNVMAHQIAKAYNQHHDPLTGLLNRDGFYYWLTKTQQETLVNGHDHTIMRVDVDRMKLINELSGYTSGDQALRLVGQVLKRHTRQQDHAARVHGDVFYCLLEHCPIDEGEVIANRMLREVRESEFLVAEQPYPISVSIGATAINSGTKTIETAITAAEVACEAAKEAGHDRLRVFTQGNVDLLQREIDFEWINQIQQALKDDRFTLHAQQIFDLQSDSPYEHYELLVRMIDQQGQQVQPDQFLPIAERYQMMPMIDCWIMRHALQTISELTLPPGRPSPLWNLNISGTTIGDDMFQAELEESLNFFQIDPASICLEIKETSATNHIQESRAFLEKLRERGVLVALDDFGTGVTSFAYLQNIDVDHLKIDGSFIRRLADDKIAATIVSSVQKVAQSMNIRTVAEKVEDDNTTALARAMGIDMAQGFGLHSPEPLESIIQRLQKAATDSTKAVAERENGVCAENVTDTQRYN